MHLPLVDEDSAAPRQRDRFTLLAALGACGLMAVACTMIASSTSGTATLLADANAGNNTTDAGEVLSQEKNVQLGVLFAQEIGSLLIIWPNVHDVWKKGARGFTEIAKEGGVKNPECMGYSAVTVNSIGSILVLVGPILELMKAEGLTNIVFGEHSWHLGAVLCMVGAFMLLGFLCYATYFTQKHWVNREEDIPRTQSGAIRNIEKELQQKVTFANIGIGGGLWGIIATCSVMGGYPFKQDMLSRIFACAPIIVGALNPRYFTLLTEDEDEKVKGLFPPALRCIQLLLGLLGSICVIVARFLPGNILFARSTVWQLVATSAGSFMVVLHLACAYTVGLAQPHQKKKEEKANGKKFDKVDEYRLEWEGHFKPKVISLIGVQLIIVATGFKKPGLSIRD